MRKVIGGIVMLMLLFVNINALCIDINAKIYCINVAMSFEKNDIQMPINLTNELKIDDLLKLELAIAKKIYGKYDELEIYNKK